MKLQDVCVSMSSNIAQKDIKDCIGNYPIYGASGLIGNVDYYKQEAPYIGIVKDGAGVGRVYMLPAKSSVIGTMQYIIPNNNIDLNYLYYALQHMHLEKYSTGATIPHIYFRDYQFEPISLPTLHEQRRKSSILQHIDKMISIRSMQVEIMDTLAKSRFIEMFGDPNDETLSDKRKSIEDVCDNIYGGGTPSKSHKEYYIGNIPWVTPKDMKSMSIDDSQDHITSEAIENSTTKLIPKKSVLMVIRSGILKHTLPVAINNVDVTINQDMKAFVPSSILTPEYLLHTFKMMEESILSKVRGVTADNIEFSEFKKRQIFIPPIELQNQFADFVALTDKSKFAVQQSIDTLQTLKAKLMQDYFG